MADIYRAILDARSDMTDWLIHFTRDSETQSAREVLLAILLEGIIRPGFAPRGSPLRNTIYGPNPAVCFTEQPLAAFLIYLAKRPQRGAVAGYGLLLHKQDVFVQGGLPVIYGLASTRELTQLENGYVPNRRMLEASSLMPREQYRYVAFAPTREPDPMDWTHEREWRWCAETIGEGHTAYNLAVPYGSSARGSFKARAHALVEKDADIAWLKAKLEDPSVKGTLGSVYPSDPDYALWWQRSINKVSIVSLETVRRELAAGNTAFARFESMPQYTLPLIQVP